MSDSNKNDVSFGDSGNRRQRTTPARRLPRRITRRIGLARALLIWETLWPGLWPAAALAGLFVSLALFGVFAGLPMGLHWAVLAAFALVLAWALWRGLRSFRWPSRDAALRHLEQASGLAHQPLGAYEDTPAEGTGDRALWFAHQRWIAQRLKKLKLGFVAPGLAARDPYGLRAIIVLLLVIGVAGTGPGRVSRIAGALLPGVGASRTFAIEAWITPPSYTGVAPIYLERRPGAEGAPGVTSSDEAALKVPVGSTLSLRIHGPRSAPSLETGNEDRGRPEPLKDLGGGNYALDAPIRDSAEFALTQGGRLMRGWKIETIPDRAPTIVFTKPLQRTASGTLRFAYKVADDYGVVSAQARVSLAQTPDAAASQLPGSRANAPATRHARATPRVTPPAISLSLPTQRPRNAQGETYVDLTPHPWAGLPVNISLVAKDDAGHEGVSEPVALTLPARAFTKPLAAAVIEQRRALAFDPTSTTRVARVLDDLTFDGARYIDDTTVYLSLRAAYWRLLVARRDSDLTGIFDLMWSIALRIEDGDLSLAENDLRDARDALAQALANGAGNDEISRLMEEMKQAFQRYMDALVARNGQTPGQTSMDKFAPQDGQTVDRDQLEKMLKEIGELARSGARDQAKAMLEQLQAIMENMQVPQQNSGMSEGEQAMAGAVDRMGKLIDKQRQLMDETFRKGAKGDPETGAGTSGGKPGEGGKGMQALKHAQEALRGELEAMMRDLEKSKVKVPSPLGKAQDQMKSAEQRLGDGRADRATASQGQAISGLREGAQGLADQLMQSMAGRQGKSGRGNARTDPFGRPMPGSATDLGSDVAVPDKIDMQRAREIIEELRRRAGELGRPKLELDYLDRLLERF
ncbi:MAG: TIGR02302 family protein [Parvibaculum sp.]|uniref:TIGR02302 family protein n=1 Tax=Parvibaculum sp. TaxID=2024848 RepID=UPI0025FA1977|nr:TIGR02302 family protein [Parvibaculum sp.]MCE9648562.1 TIGR02302 family protein [Parvibaculum sp.]